MFTRKSMLLFGLLGAIAVGCGNTTSNTGTGSTADVLATTDTAVSDTQDTDAQGGADADAEMTDTLAGTDASGGTDAASGSDADADATMDIDVLLTICPNVLKDKALGQHGTKCTQDADCAYGFCQKGGFLVGYDDALGYCTKDCNCPDKSANCSDDNANSKEFTCGHELSKSGGNPKAGVVPEWRCALHCKNDADCAPWNPAMPHCIQSTNYVSSSGICGFDPFK
jgi:hypothetical protein